jgi:hypothetical protein
MATTPDRARYAVYALRSLQHQVDRFTLYFNGTEAGMEEDTRREIERTGCDIMFSPAGDLTDAGKFYPVIAEDDNWLTVDDDLLYPPDYVERFKVGLDKYPTAILTFHGVTLTKPFVSYYRSRTVFRCLGEVTHDEHVMIGGSGVACLPPSFIFHREEEWPYMGDLILARAAKLEGVSIVCLSHKAGWIQHQAIDHSQTIFSRFSRNDAFQTWFANRYLLS